ncbi:SRR1-like protein [Skeletonema marinoi]|uniref:SRR1-like protein n=1 Tax=Skeletonema marinoi TaxID=267567 RepID=A0AAD8YBW6_9STRA|nr:SRR1-like protein [Skeletonema marinoi]
MSGRGKGGKGLGKGGAKRHRKVLRDNIQGIISALENVWMSSETSFSYRLIDALREVTTSSSANKVEEGAGNKSETKNEEGNDDDDNESNQLNIREIVAYGIGNFATSSFSAPMLQLACVLFLRRRAASSIITDSNDDDNASNDNDIQDVFKREQDQVPIYYYEPCILPEERDLLEIFHVAVLEKNEFGKLRVQSMRRQDGEKASATTTSITSASKKSLFYMPHCPMRLYCNVLWSHWESLDSTIIYGNSFHSYDERTLSEEGRTDPTNGILRIIPCTNEIPIKLRGNRRGDELYDALNHLETAFNDCNIISFMVDKTSDRTRPDEYFASQDNENGELSR